MARPNFVYIGAAKSGSTWLYNALLASGQVKFPGSKELYFFDKYYDRGLSWYESKFKDVPHDVRCGEISHDYLYSEFSAERMHKDLPPESKIICFLRDPVDKCFSSYLFRVRNGLMTCSFKEALEKDPELLENVMYFKYLIRFKELFGDRLRVFFYEDLSDDPNLFAKDVFHHLGLEFNEDYDFAKKINPASKPRSRLLAFIVKRGAGVARDVGLQRLISIVKNSRLVSALLYKKLSSDERPKPSPDEVELVVSKVKKDVLSLDVLLDGEVQTRWSSYFEE